MSKGRFPKHKGTISDGSIDTAETDNVLLRGAESNLIVVVKLKYKLCYRGHVYLIHQVLAYLKENNTYSDISINLG